MKKMLRGIKKGINKVANKIFDLDEQYSIFEKMTVCLVSVLGIMALSLNIALMFI